MGIITESVSASPGWRRVACACTVHLETERGQAPVAVRIHCGAPRSLSLPELRCYAIKTASAQCMGAC